MQVVANMREILKMTKNVVPANIILQMKVFMKVNLKMTRCMEKEPIPSLMEMFIPEALKMANEKEEVIITRNGHPYALLPKIKEDDIEDYILAKHFCLESEFKTAKEEYKQGKTVNAHDLLNDLSKLDAI